MHILEAKSLNGLVKLENEKRKTFLLTYGRLLPKEFIPDLNLYAKYFFETQTEKYPKIEGEHDESYTELFKQFENGQEGILKQEEKILELKRELTRLKENPGKNINNSNNNNPSSANAGQLEIQNSELRQQIIKLKNEVELYAVKKREDSACAQQIEIEVKKNAILTNRIAQLETQLKDVSGGQVSKLQKELEDLEKAYQNVHNFYRKDQAENENTNNVLLANNNFNNNIAEAQSSSSEDSKTIMKLNQRVTNLTQLLQQTAKVSFNSFLRKQSEKNGKLQEKMAQLECKNIALQEESLKQKNKMQAFFEEKLKSTDNKYYMEQKKMTNQLEVARQSHREEAANLNAALKQQENDLLDKAKQIRNSQEQIARLNAQITQRQKESDELARKMSASEAKVKQECARQVSELQASLAKESEKTRKRISALEIDLANKQSQLQNTLKDLNDLKRDLDVKNEEFEKIRFELDTVKNERERLKRDAANLKNKIENLELLGEKRLNEISGLNKSIIQLNGEKSTLVDELNKERSVVNDQQRRMQQQIESLKNLDAERNRLSAEIGKLRLEIEKKSIEAVNLSKQLQEYSTERTKQIERIQESQLSEKMRIEELTEEVQNYRISTSVAATKLQIHEADLIAKESQLAVLRETLTTRDREIEEMDKKMQSMQEELDHLSIELEAKQAETTNLHEGFKQALIETEIQQQNAIMAKSKMQKNEEEHAQELQRITEEIDELRRNLANCKEREKKTNSLNQEINAALLEMKDRLAQKESELEALNEEVSSSRNNANLNEMSLRQLNNDVREKEESLSAAQERADRAALQVEDIQKTQLFMQQEAEAMAKEVESLSSQLTVMRENCAEKERKNNELEKNVLLLEGSKIEFEKSLAAAEEEKEKGIEAFSTLSQNLDKITLERNRLSEELRETITKFEQASSQSVSLEVHSLALQKMEEQLEQKEILLQQITKEQGQLAQELIDAETGLKNTTKELQTQERLAQKRLQSITDLQAKLNIEKKDQESQWEEESETDEKCLTLSSYEAQKFRKILRGIDHQKKIPVMSQKNMEHIDISQALKRTAFIQDAINYTRLEEGTKMLFIPSTEGIYIPLVMRQLNDRAFLQGNTTENDTSLTVTSYKNNYFLDFDTLDKKYIELLRECQLLLVASIKNIIPKQVNLEQNQFGLREGESYFLLQVEQPEYILGLEDDDHVIKNYI